MRALVIDDSPSMRMYISSLIEDQGFETTMARDGQDGLRKLEAEQSNGGFALATVDWDMPILDGPGFVAAVRADPRFRNMKLLMVTSQQQTDEMVNALVAGADDYLVKPITPEMVEEKIRIVGLGR